jgi:predicted dehydrogenase
MNNHDNHDHRETRQREQSDLTRRSFITRVGVGAVAAPFFVRNLFSAPPSNVVRLASFGGDNMALTTLRELASHPSVQLVCVAEVDSSRLRGLNRAFPDGKVRIYQDWRRMLDKERKNLDAVCVGTPDHMHAPMTMSAMRLGLHAYTQKPLTHDLYEARQLNEFARKKKLVTQMGIQVHANSAYRTAVELVHSGAIGKVREVHSWSEKKWGDPNPRPDRSDPVPPTLDWEGWLGVAAARPYIEGYYHPSEWRKRLDFGTSTFGDMGCHILDPVFSAVGLTAPITVRSDGPEPNATNWAINAVVSYVFPGTAFTEDKTLKLTWYDGDQRPPAEVKALLEGRALPGQGSIFIGSKGVMLLPHTSQPVLFPAAQFKDFQRPKLDSGNHYHEFIDAVLGKGKTATSFDYSGPLTEVVLLGSLATHFPQTTLQWQAKKLKFKNVREANAYVRRRYRRGWEVKGLS